MSRIPNRRREGGREPEGERERAREGGRRGDIEILLICENARERF